MNIVYREQKKEYAKTLGHILLDDSIENIEQWTASGGSGFAFTTAEAALKYIAEIEEMH
ncbi:MAG: hypothetical protein MJ107_04720 [Lachnospiraceae bacterium]|nr:hypothetical protein [Lachnospiraceae bacterium]